MTKAELIHAAEVFDTWRVVPRVLLACYSWFLADVTYRSLFWYFHEPATGRGTQETAVLLGVLTTLTGLAGFVFKVYTENGRDWSEHPAHESDTDPHAR